MSETETKTTERIEWKAGDGRKALTALVARLTEGDPVTVVYHFSDGRLEATGEMRRIAGRAAVVGGAIAQPETVAVTADVAPLEPPRPAWADCQVVRDKEGRYWVAHGDFWYTPGWTPRPTGNLAAHFGLITPVIDAEGRPVLSDDDLDRAALAAWKEIATADVTVTQSIPVLIRATLRETLGGA